MNVNIGNDEYWYRIYRINMSIIDMNMSKTSIISMQTHILAQSWLWISININRYYYTNENTHTHTHAYIYIFYIHTYMIMYVFIKIIVEQSMSTRPSPNPPIQGFLTLIPHELNGPLRHGKSPGKTSWFFPWINWLDWLVAGDSHHFPMISPQIPSGKLT